MLSKQLTDKIIDTAMAGGDFVEVFCEHNQQTTIESYCDRLESSAVGVEAGVGIRVLNGISEYYACTNDLTEDALLSLAKHVGSQSREKRALRAPLAVLRNYSGKPGIRLHHADVDYGRKLEVVDRALRAGKAYHDEIVQMKVKYLDQTQEVLIANSQGTYVHDEREKTRLYIMAYARGDGGMHSGYIGPGAMEGFEYYDRVPVEEYARDAARMARVNLHAEKCRGGRMPVVVAAGFGGLLFHEACGHSLESAAVSKGLSEFCGKMGRQVASSILTLVDDGSMPGQWGSLRVDDEGTRTQRNVLIKNGILNSYLVDRMGSRRMGLPVTGSARRQNYRFLPTARMTNTFIEAGESDPEDLVSATERGLYVAAISGGSVNPATGDFNFAAAESYLIDNGRITRPVSGATLIGNGMGVIRSVDMVANNLKIRQGYCYAGSGQLFVGVGQPAVRVSAMTVGGVGT